MRSQFVLRNRPSGLAHDRSQGSPVNLVVKRNRERLPPAAGELPADLYVASNSAGSSPRNWRPIASRRLYASLVKRFGLGDNRKIQVCNVLVLAFENADLNGSLAGSRLV